MSDDDYTDAISDAYLAGAEAVHDYCQKWGVPDGAPDFAESASDYAASVSTPTQAPVDDAMRERVARAMVASIGLDWDHRDQSYKPQSTEYANHDYWLPIADAAIAALQEPPHAD